MKKKLVISFRETTVPIVEPVTKFGGRPVWLEKVEWPRSKTTGAPMMFVGQIALAPEIFGRIEGRMAYLFIEDDDPSSDTFEPDGGDNAVIVQPNGNNPSSISAETGKTLYVYEDSPPPEKMRQTRPCEFAVELEPAADPEDFEGEENGDALSENKIGGTPAFLQSEQFPDGERENWKLLLQLDSVSVPFEINFGDAGIGYAFLSHDGKTGKFLWQCC